MRILIHMLPEPGHLNPAFPLAQLLADRGHEVIFTTVIDLRQHVEARGFRCVVIHDDILGRGRLAQIAQLTCEDDLNAVWDGIRNRIEDEYFGGDIEDLVRGVDPALILADIIMLSPIQFVAYRLGIPCIQLSTSAPQQLDDDVPPLTSELTPTHHPLELATSRWQSSTFRRIPRREVSLVATLLAVKHEQLCARFGYPAEQISVDTVFWPSLGALPEIVLAPAAFDFPRRRAVQYFPPALDVQRPEQIRADLERFASSERPLIFAALGSQSGRYPDAPRFFRAVVECAVAHPEWSIVVATGPRFFAAAMFADAPANLFVMRSVPQLWLLRRAAVFVTHAGLGSIREAIALGTPVIAVPQQYDQQGNAARVLHHGLGLVLRSESIDGGALAAAVERVLVDREGYVRRGHELDEACRRHDRHVGIEVFENVPAPQPRVAPACPPARVEPRRDGWLMTVPRHGLVVFRPGATLHDPDDPIDVGHAGFTIATDLATALRRATGSLLVHGHVVDDVKHGANLVVGRRLVVAWRLDVEHVLFEHARWCAEQALAVEPDRAVARALLDRLATHAASRRSADAAERVLSFRELFGLLAPQWYRPGRAVVAAATPLGHEAARRSQRVAAQVIAHHAVGTATGAPGADVYHRVYQTTRATFAAELEQRIRERIRDARVEVLS